MPPIKKLNANPPVVPNRRVVTRSALKPQNGQELPKRKAGTPPKIEAEHKRQVLLDITNEKKVLATAENRKNVLGNLKNQYLNVPKPVPKPQENFRVRFTRCTTMQTRTRITNVSKLGVVVESKKVTTKSVKSQVPKINFPEVKLRSGASSASSSASSCKGALARLAIKDDVATEVSGDSEDGELFVTVCESMSAENSKIKATSGSVEKVCVDKSLQSKNVPEGVKDFDKDNLSNLIEVGEYAMDVFEYLKNIEDKYKIDDYMQRQQQIGTTSRAQLIDWMVELQEYFELNHESLYLAVKMLDHYLCKKTIPITVLQVVGMACMLLASKYEERFPPTLDDLLFISDHVCTRSQLIKMEQEVLQTLSFELGMPLSYCFLRRYARCIQLSLQDLTLARYILELSLIEFSFVPIYDSKMACAALLLALKMLKISEWTPTLEYYTGYKEADFIDLLPRLNSMLHKEKSSARHHRVFVKYSDGSFFKVATIELLKDESCDEVGKGESCDELLKGESCDKSST